jgi:uncharacterized membrane protein YciS (DUF1049 family)
MNFKVVFRLLVFLAIFFVMLYIGMNNTERITFSFPLAFSKDIHTQAAIIFFGIFAVGVLGGAVLSAGSGKGGGKSRASKDK